MCRSTHDDLRNVSIDTGSTPKDREFCRWAVDRVSMMCRSTHLCVDRHIWRNLRLELTYVSIDTLHVSIDTSSIWEFQFRQKDDFEANSRHHSFYDLKFVPEEFQSTSEVIQTLSQPRDQGASKRSHRNQVESVEYIDPSLSAQSLLESLPFCICFHVDFCNSHHDEGLIP